MSTLDSIVQVNGNELIRGELSSISVPSYKPRTPATSLDGISSQDIFSQGKDFILGIVEHKPQSAAALLGKVHAADIIAHLLNPELDNAIRYASPRPGTIEHSVSAGFAQVLEHQQVALVFSPQAAPTPQPPTVAPEEELPPPPRRGCCLVM